MCLLVVVFIFNFFQASLYTFDAFRAQMLSSLPFRSACVTEFVFFRVAAEERLAAAKQARPQCFFFPVGFHVSSVQ